MKIVFLMIFISMILSIFLSVMESTFHFFTSHCFSKSCFPAHYLRDFIHFLIK